MIDDTPSWESKYAITDIEAKATGKVSIEDKKRQLGSQVFSYEMMNQPIDDSIAEFKKEWIQRAEEKDFSHLSYNTYICLDTAVSEKESADYTGVTICRVTSENKWYITSYHQKFNTTGLIDHLFFLYQLYKPNIIGIEETSFTVAIKPFLEEEMRKRGVFMSIYPLKHAGRNKEARIR